MEKTLVFTHRLDLALRLVDTTSGRNVSGQGVKISMDGDPVPFGEKQDQILIFQNLGKRTFQLGITSREFEPMQIQVDLDGMKKELPLLEVHMIPSGQYLGGTEFLTIEGTLDGIQELSAVRMGENACLIREIDPRKRLIKVFNPYHLAMDRVQYALVDPDQRRYESFRILRLTDDQTLKVDRTPEMPFRNYFPITPQISGVARPDGSYCLRVRDEGEEARWLVRWVVRGEVKFREIDFRKHPNPCLEEEV